MAEALSTLPTTETAFRKPRWTPGFWTLQAIGWSGLCVVTFLSLTVWYGTPNWSHVTHTAAQAAIGAMLGAGLKILLDRLWGRPATVQIPIAVGLVVVTSALWTALRMQAFLWLAEEYDIWADFGGWYFGSFMVFLSWTAFYYGLRYFRMFERERAHRQQAVLDVQAEQLRRLEAEAGARDAQMRMLRYQVNPHFLFNTLNSVSALVKTDRVEQARDMLSQLSGFLRHTLDGDPTVSVQLAEEIRMLDLYLAIEQTRFGTRLRVERDIDDSVLELPVPSLILQPLVENALQATVAGVPEGGTIRLRVRREADSVILGVEDSGPGLNAEPVEGIGLSNIRRRLATHYSEQARITFGRSSLGGAKIELIIPAEFTR